MLLVETSGLTKSFTTARSRVDVLRGVDLRIESGGMTAIVGRSGSGKSTLLQIIGALTPPDAGSVRVCGVDLARADRAAASALRRDGVGFVFQSAALLPQLTATQNVALPAKDGVRAGLERARTLLDRVGLADRTGHRPAQLSGGEQQRVALARALINSPQLVLADEPTGNLDDQTEAEILTLLRSVVADDTAVVVVTHDEAVARAADRVVTLDHGRTRSQEVVA